jgi:hypothetical protein
VTIRNGIGTPKSDAEAVQARNVAHRVRHGRRQRRRVTPTVPDRTVRPERRQRAGRCERAGATFSPRLRAVSVDERRLRRLFRSAPAHPYEVLVDLFVVLAVPVLTL